MFLVEANGKAGIWQNSMNDDFIQFLPNFFGCLPKDISVTYIPDAQGRDLLEFAQQPGKRIEVGGGKVSKFEMKKVMVDDQEVEQEFSAGEVIGQALVESWPYQEKNGKLVFNGLKIKE